MILGRVLKQTNVFDAFDGSLLQTSTKYQQSLFGVGWVMINKRARDVFDKVDKSAALVFFFLLLKQTYQPTVFISAESIATAIGVNKSTVYRALKELEQAQFIQRPKEDGVRTIMLNPSLTACGKSALVTRRQMWAANNLIEETLDKEGDLGYDEGNQSTEISD